MTDDPRRDAMHLPVGRGLEDNVDTGGPVEVPVEILFGSGRK